MTIRLSGFCRTSRTLPLLRGAVKLVGSRRPVGKAGETHGVFPGLSLGDRGGEVRRGSVQPTVDKLTAASVPGVRGPVPLSLSIGRVKLRPVLARREPVLVD